MNPKLSLSETEHAEAQRFVRQGKANARTLTRAWVVLKLADGWDEAKIAETFAISQATVKNVAQRFAKGGLDLVLHDRVQQRRRQALTGQQAAHLIATTCSPAPDGHDHWTVRLLAGKAVELGFVKSISPNTIHELLKKTNSSPGSTNTGACRQWEGTL
jgi:transposase